MIDHFQPGQQRLVELGERCHFGAGQFGQEIGLEELEEAFDFALAFGVVGRGQDALNTEGGADGVKLFGGVDLAAIDINGLGNAVAQDGPRILPSFSPAT